MTTTHYDEDSWMARQPWVIAVLLGLAALTIGLHLYARDAWGTARSACFYGAMFLYVMYQRTGKQPYRWAAFAGIVLMIVLMVIGSVLK